MAYSKFYDSSAKQADMFGYGLRDDTVLKYRQDILDSVYTGKGLPDGKGGFLPLSLLPFLPAAISAIKSLVGSGLSGGDLKVPKVLKSTSGYPVKYPGSFPMPGFYPPSTGPGEGMTLKARGPEYTHYLDEGMGLLGRLGHSYGGDVSLGRGGMLSGGVHKRTKRIKNPSRVQAGKAAAKNSEWLRKVRELREKEGISQKEAFKRLKGTM